jgi:hypothetical protein
LLSHRIIQAKTVQTVVKLSKNLDRLEPISVSVDVFWIGMKTPQSTSLKGD